MADPYVFTEDFLLNLSSKIFKKTPFVITDICWSLNHDAQMFSVQAQNYKHIPNRPTQIRERYKTLGQLKRLSSVLFDYDYLLAKELLRTHDKIYNDPDALLIINEKQFKANLVSGIAIITHSYGCNWEGANSQMANWVFEIANIILEHEGFDELSQSTVNRYLDEKRNILVPKLNEFD
jgi:hypothetical protein